MKNDKLTHNSTPSGIIEGPVDWEGGPVDWRAWEAWMVDIGYRGRGYVTKVDWGRFCELRV